MQRQVGTSVQRLFSMFPDGRPGAGLLILRVAVAVPLMLGGRPELREVPHSWLQAIQFVTISVGTLLLAGLWTPVVGALQAMIQLWIVIAQRSDASIHYLLAALGVSLVMLGPGAWSVDARLFGRKRLDIHKREGLLP